MAQDVALLLVLANLHTAHPRVELQIFETFKECRTFAIKQNHIGYYAPCVDAWSKRYPEPPPLRAYKKLWVRPKGFDRYKTFYFHRPTIEACEAEALALEKQGHEAECSHTGIGVMAPR
jgi:hypothetical protein